MPEIYYAIGRNVGDIRPARKHSETIKTFFDTILNRVRKVKIDPNADKDTIDDAKNGRYVILAKLNGKGRHDHHVLESYGACIDIDDTAMDQDELYAKLEELGFVYCCYTTFKHQFQDYGNRFRIIIPFKKPLNHEQHAATYKWLTNKIDPYVKCTTFNPSRVSYLPSCPISNQDEYSSWFELYQKGVYEFLDYEKYQEQIADFMVGDEEEDEEDWAFRGMEKPYKKAEFRESLEEGDGFVGEGGRNNALYSYACSLLAKGEVTNAQLRKACFQFCEEKMDKPLTRKEVALTIQSARAKHAHNNNIKDFDKLSKTAKRIAKLDENKTIDNTNTLLMDVAHSINNQYISDIETDRLLDQLAKSTKTSKTTLKSQLKKEVVINKKQNKDNPDLKNHVSLSKENTKTLKEIKEDLKDIYFLSNQGKFFDANSKKVMSKDHTNLALASLANHPDITANVAFDILRYKLVRVVNDVMYHPQKPQIFKFQDEYYCNSYHSYLDNHHYIEEWNVAPFINHMRKLIPLRNERKAVLQFLAHNIQHVGKKIMWMPVIKGPQRSGKSFIIAKIMVPLLGMRNAFKFDPDSIEDKYTDWQTNGSLLYCEELQIGKGSQSSKRVLTDSMKSPIADDILTIRERFRNDRQQLNVTNYIAFTNYDDVLSFSQEEARYMFIKSPMRNQGSQYYIKFKAWIDNNLDHLYSYFMDMNLDDFDIATAPETLYTKQIKQVSNTWEENIVQELLADSDFMSLVHAQNFITWDLIQSAAQLHATRNSFLGSLQIDTIKTPMQGMGRKLINALSDRGFTLVYEDNGTGRSQRFKHKESRRYLLFTPTNEDMVRPNCRDANKQLIDICDKLKREKYSEFSQELSS